MESWLERYRPKTIDEIYGNKYEIQLIDTFINQFSPSKKGSIIDTKKIQCANIIITGKNGIGKTLVVDLILQKYGITKINIDISTISISRKNKKKKKGTEKEITGGQKTIKTFYLSMQNRRILLPNGQLQVLKTALVIDDVSSISNLKEKEAIKSLVKLNSKLKRFPIIIIGNTKHNKTVNELRKLIVYSIKTKKNENNKSENKKITNEISLKRPEYNEMQDIIKTISTKESLKLVKNKKLIGNDIYNAIIKHCQADIRRLINILEELKMIYGDEPISITEFNRYRETSKTKDMDPGIYEATRQLLNNYKNIESSLNLYSEERATVPLMVHENYPLNISQQYPDLTNKQQISIMFDVSKYISDSDNVDGLIYSNQCWSLQTVHGFYSCVMPSYLTNRFPNKLTTMETYEYTKDYNKTSIKKINNKVIKKAQIHTFLKKVSIYDFLYISSILKTLIARNEFNTIQNLVKPYGIKTNEIESIIKIDKVRKTKNSLTCKQKSLLKEKLDD